MIDHLSTYATDYSATHQFYQAVFGVLGYAIQAEFELDDDAEFPKRKICAWGPPGKTTSCSTLTETTSKRSVIQADEERIRWKKRNRFDFLKS